MNGSDIVGLVEETIVKYKLLERGERIIAAVSGGPDSMALLHVLYRLSSSWDWRITVAHVNHGLRGEESDEEELFVQARASELGLDFSLSRLHMKQLQEYETRNLQAAARSLRYEAFKEAAAAAGAGAIALGHHADDQAETVLMRILHGTGPGGLAGIRISRELFGMKLVRPLLRISKSDLESYCLDYGLEFRRDSSNFSRKYFRNAIRLDILPYLMKHRSGVAESLARLAEISADESDLLDEQATELASRLLVRTDQGFRGERLAIANLHNALQRRMFKIILSCLGTDDSSIDFLKLERMREAIKAEAPSNMELRLADRLYFRRTYDVIEWTAQAKPEAASYEYRIEAVSEGKLYIGEAGAWLEWKVCDISDFLDAASSDLYVALFDADLLDGGLLVRNRRSGDRLEPFGLKGSKKVKDMFIDLKISPERRDIWPMVFSDSGILLWMPGIRRSRHAPVDQSSRRVLCLAAKGDFFEK